MSAPKITIPPALKIVGGLVLVGGGAYVGNKIYKNWKQDKQAAELLKLQAASTVKGLNAFGKPVTVNLTTVAADIYDALHGAIDDDEPRAIRAFKSTPVVYINKLSEIYYKVYKLNLKEDFRKYFNDQEFIQVKYFFK